MDGASSVTKMLIPVCFEFAVSPMGDGGDDLAGDRPGSGVCCSVCVAVNICGRLDVTDSPAWNDKDAAAAAAAEVAVPLVGDG